MIQTMHSSGGGTLDVGTDLTPPGGPSRSCPTGSTVTRFGAGRVVPGKTFALGLVLERLLARTALPVVVFDPNSDFVRLGELRHDASGPDAEALAQREIRWLFRALPGAMASPLTVGAHTRPRGRSTHLGEPGGDCWGSVQICESRLGPSA